jgi:hypothetical protein
MNISKSNTGLSQGVDDPFFSSPELKAHASELF